MTSTFQPIGRRFGEKKVKEGRTLLTQGHSRRVGRAVHLISVHTTVVKPEFQDPVQLPREPGKWGPEKDVFSAPMVTGKVAELKEKCTWVLVHDL